MSFAAGISRNGKARAGSTPVEAARRFPAAIALLSFA
jgi:hypothetical protein